MTHLPYRSWCSICVQARGRQNNHPKQHSTLPIIQLDFGYIKGFDDSNVHPILTAIDIQSGMIVARQLTDKIMLFDYAVTQLQHFLIECGRTTHTIQSDQEDFLTALTTAVANKNGNIAARNSGAYRSRASAQNIVCANQNTQGTDQTKLQQRQVNETPMDALGSSTQRIHHEQVCSSQQWMHKLLQQTEQRATYTTLQVWWDSATHATNSETISKTRAEILQRDLAWQGYNHRRIPSWDLQQDCQRKDNQKADYASQIQSATTGLCAHRSMEDTSISTAHTNSRNTSDNANYKQGTAVTERCNN